jgi:hypothetical protein
VIKCLPASLRPSSNPSTAKNKKQNKTKKQKKERKIGPLELIRVKSFFQGSFEEDNKIPAKGECRTKCAL